MSVFTGRPNGDVNPDLDGRLAGRVTVVTGSSRGIGAAIAKRFAAEGAHVVLHGRDLAALERVRDRLPGAGDRLVVRAELRDPDDVEAMRDRVEGSLGVPDILVANAGGNLVRPGPIDEISLEDWSTTVDSNLTATFNTIQAFLPGMRRLGRGSIVTMSSAAARRPTVNSPVAYMAAKAGIELLTRAVALHAGPDGVRANCLAPETILTESNEEKIPLDVRDRLIAGHPIRRLGTPDDIAEAALFLAADASAWISGVILDVAGGSVLV
jgi:3-oxoacyl-[acyl-carrier protein] reductase